MRAKHAISSRVKWAGYGAFFGLLFPALIFALHWWELAPGQGFLELHLDMHDWIILTAPLFLGYFASLGGQQQDQAIAISTDLEQKVKDRTRELIKSNQRLKSFNFLVAHDLKNPLFATISCIDLVDDAISELRNDDEKVRVASAFAPIGKAAHTMEIIIRSILAFTSGGLNRGTLEMVPINEIVERAFRQINYLVDKKKGSLQSLVSHDLIYCNRGLIEQVMVNLLTNSLKYSSPDRRPKVVVTSTNSDGSITLEIADNGIGMAKDQIDRAFTKFGRLHDQSKITEEGQGIGLYFIREIIMLHFANISVTSKPGEGTTFSIEFLPPQRAKSLIEAEISSKA